ncbi:Phospholipid:diacylglycerol acyltransferase 1 [Quillaja saponaria]|uniref:Phospholipid:diacylglycerol acyltransferase 1 n=1 Tax=Quillaja saponaria TaxID=32244 RepID=A0AAD7KXN8_QUISA|nr:Phospholipid:diacylglycerol acyltransferase 1 [Quillaja saponaria]
MDSIVRFRKLCYVVPVKCLSLGFQKTDENIVEKKQKKGKSQPKEWKCIDYCCWVIGYICVTWWLLCFIYNCLPSTFYGFQIPESPGALGRQTLCRGPLQKAGSGVVVLLKYSEDLCVGWSTSLCIKKLAWTHLAFECVQYLGLLQQTILLLGTLFGLFLSRIWLNLVTEGKNLHMAAYDWRLSFQNTEIRDQALSRLKSKIELMFVTNGNKKVVVVPHSMGVIYFFHFLKWVETATPTGGGGGPGWCAKHIKAIMNIGPAFLGVPKAVSNIFSAEGKDVGFYRSMAPGVLDFDYLGLKTLEHIMRVCRTWDSIISLLPKGRIISFGKPASPLPSSMFPTLDSKEISCGSNSSNYNLPSGEVWSEYDEMSRESIRKVAENKAYTAGTVLDLLRFVAPKMMRLAEAHFSHGIAENLDDPKYAHYKYWSNPLEASLPDAPDMEIFCLYGVGIPTERSYIYKLSPSAKCKSIPFRIDSSAGGEEGSCLKRGVYFVDGDETVPSIVLVSCVLKDGVEKPGSTHLA